MADKNETTTAVATVEPANLPAPTFGAQMQLRTLANAMEFAKVVMASGLAPKGMNPEGVVIAMQMGYEVGLSPMQAIQNIASINGRPAIWGDAQLALVRASGLLESYSQEIIGEPGTDGRGCRVGVKRVGSPACVEEFTVGDAKRAGLWGKQGPWTQYPQRMLLFRARGFILRDQFGDVLKGLRSAEEVMDEPREIDITAVATDRPADTAGARLSRKKAQAAEAAPVQAEAKVEPPPAAEPAEATGQPYALESVKGALEGAGLKPDVVEMWALGSGRLEKGQTLADLSDAVKQWIVEKPGVVAAAVKAWADAPQKGEQK